MSMNWGVTYTVQSQTNAEWLSVGQEIMIQTQHMLLTNIHESCCLLKEPFCQSLKSYG